MGWLGMPWLYGVGLLIGCVYTVAGTAAQIVLTQVVARERLVEAHAKNALASSGAEVAGPGVAGLLIKLVGAPLALVADALLLLFSAAILRGMRVHERLDVGVRRHFWQRPEGRPALRRQPAPARHAGGLVGLWQMSHHAAMVVQILFATRSLGLSEQAVGLSYVGLGVGTVSGQRARAPHQRAASAPGPA
jgi:hypothetical protein